MAQDYNENARKWLEGDFDPETKMKVLELRNNDPAGFEDAFYKNLEFGTGGLRGIMGVGTNRMNKYTVGMATQGLSNYIQKRRPAMTSASAFPMTAATTPSSSPRSHRTYSAPMACMCSSSTISVLRRN